jgi:hypothetical protein
MPSPTDSQLVTVVICVTFLDSAPVELLRVIAEYACFGYKECYFRTVIGVIRFSEVITINSK